MKILVLPIALRAVVPFATARAPSVPAESRKS